MHKVPPMTWSTRPAAAVFAAVVFACASLNLGAPSVVLAAEAADPAAIRQLVYDMEKAYEKVQDYTTTFHKQERVDGKLLPREEILLKFRKPFSVYMRWIGEVNQTREVIFEKGWNSDKIRAHKGSFPDITVNLRPDSSMAMQGNRHSIYEAPFGHSIGMLARDARLSAARPQDDVRYVDLGERVVYGARSRCIEAYAPSGPDSPYYAARAKVCFHLATKMPTRITVWDEAGDLLEDYGYEDTQLNVGLTDTDFDPGNSEYNF